MALYQRLHIPECLMSIIDPDLGSCDYLLRFAVTPFFTYKSNCDQSIESRVATTCHIQLIAIRHSVIMT